MKPTAVIFDMDGVITDTMHYHCVAWKKIFHSQDVPATDFDIYKREGQKGLESVKEIFEEYGKKFIKKEGLKLLDQKEELFKKIVKQRFIVGSRTFLKHLKKNDYQLALVTGTAHHEVKKILPDYIYSLFDVIVSGCDVKKGKPHPEPYSKAVKKLKLDPKKGIVIENAPFGIKSAKAAKLKCYAIETSLPKKHLKEADKVFHSIKDLEKFLKL